MIDPITGAAALSTIGSLYQLGTGIQQGIRARRLAKTPRPNYNIPNEITDNVNLAKNAYGASTAYGLPGQNAITSANNRATANAMQGISQSQQSPASILAGYTALDQNTKNTNADLGVKAAMFRANQMNAARGQLMGANRVLAQYRDQAFNTNQMQPYNNTMNAAAALRQGAITNTYGALDNLGGLASGMMLRKSGQQPTATPSTTAKTPINTGQPQVSSPYKERMRLRPPYNTMSDEEFNMYFPD